MEIEKKRMENMTAKVTDLTPDAEIEIATEKETSEEDFISPTLKTRLKKKGTNIYIPHDILKKPKVVSSSVRNKISPTALAATIAALVESCDGDSSALNLNPTQARRYRSEAVSQIAEQIKEDWKPPSPASIHWDGKLMETLTDKYSTDDRLPVLISGVGGVKLLGVPALPVKSSESAGSLISSATVNLVEEWSCKEEVSSLVFDTTSANTGRLSAGCICIQVILNKQTNKQTIVLLQEKLDKALLWCACRKHVGEVLLTKAWDALNVEASRSPEISVFLRFREKFPFLDLELPLASEEHTSSFLASQREEVIVLLLKMVADEECKDLFPRGDYKELVDLTLLYFGAKDPSEVKIQRPGATHKARWMARLLHTLKIVLLKRAVKDSMSGRDKWISDAALQKIERFVTFATHVYVPWWFQCPVSASAPHNDLSLIKLLHAYAEVDEVISSAVLSGFKNHLWYLVCELTPLGLFDPAVSEDQKSHMASAILSSEKCEEFQNRHGTGYGKPCFPEIPSSGAELKDFIGSDSWKFFDLLKINPDFLNCSPDSWTEQESYLEGQHIVKNLRVCNDSAERGVKLSADFLGSAKTEKNYQKILQVVENDRKEKPNQKTGKRVSPDTWYLHL